MMKFTNFKDLYDNSPDDLKKLVWDQWNAPQNSEWHPEGNTLKHIIYVVKRAIKYHPDDNDMIISAFFHDLGKFYTLGVNPKTGKPTAYGHEHKSTEFVKFYSSWIESMGGDPSVVEYVVKNHMLIKPKVWEVMRKVKKDVIINDLSYQKLVEFGKLDKGGNEL